MRVGSVVMALAVLIAAAVCVRLGFWQVSRLHEKQALNAELRAVQAAPPLIVNGEPPDLEVARQRPLEIRGTFDEARQFLLSGRANAGTPGVHVVTPLRLDGAATAVLVDRGWLPSADAAKARPQEFRETGERVVRGLADPLKRGLGGPPVRTLESDSVTLWSARWLDADSVARRLPYAVAGYLVRELPGPGVPPQPRRIAPSPFNEMTHVSYAIQWFLFATIMLVGGAALAWSRARRPRPGTETLP
jgi:surfeit locus 1 family protein